MSEDNKKVSPKPFLLLFVVLAVWAVLIAIGILRQPQADARKAIFIFVTVAAFVSIWGIALFTGKSK